jgi:hypothetical protein
MATSKLYKGIQTMMNEYKSVDAVGEQDADRIKVTGEVELEEYYGKDDTLKSFNKIKGVFFNRLDESTDQPDKAIASIETVVKSFAPVDVEGEILHYAVNCFTVGYGEKVVELKKVIVNNQMADAMQNLYESGSTGRLTFNLNNYVEKIEKEVAEEPVSMSHGFGSEEKVEASRVFDKFVNNYEITGGDLPFEEPKALTVEQIQAAERSLALAREELKQAKTQAPATPKATAQPTGFGGNITMPTGMNIPPVNIPATAPVASTPTPSAAEDEVPDF